MPRRSAISTSSANESDPELLHEIVPMRLDGPFRGSEFVGDLLVQSAPCHAFENLALPRGEAAHEPSQQLELVICFLPHAPARDGPLDRGQQRVLRDRLRQQVFRARFDNLHGGRDIAVTRQEDDGQVRSQIIQASLQLGPAERRDPDIEKDAAAAGVLGKLREQRLP